MKEWQKNTLWTVLIALLAAALWYWWTHQEKKWVALIDDNFYSQAQELNLMQHLAQKRGYQVKQYDSIHDSLQQAIPGGTVFLSDSNGRLLPPQQETLKKWVAQGNTLLLLLPSPRGYEKQASKHLSDQEAEQKRREKEDQEEKNREGEAQDADEEGEDEAGSESTPQGVKIEHDPFGKMLGVQRIWREKNDPCNIQHREANKCTLRLLRFAGLEYDLRMRPGWDQLQERVSLDATLDAGRAPRRGSVKSMLSEGAEDVLRIYPHGQGHIVVMAVNPFINSELGYYDHAEIMMALLELNPRGKSLSLIKNLDYLPWYKAAWDHGWPMLSALACTLALLLWLGLRRFGPLLPEPESERRALIEHVDASARWLWHLSGGPEILLSSARQHVLHLLRRRHPDWNVISAQTQVERLADLHQLNQEKLHQALHGNASANPHQFTEQVKTLQILRKHYERK